jgi:Amt family ammonium transporter
LIVVGISFLSVREVGSDDYETEKSETCENANIAWMLTATALVMIMTLPGLALYYGGFSMKSSHLNTMSMVFVSFSISVVIWVAYGYSLTYSHDYGGIIGSLDKAFLFGLSPKSENVHFKSIPEYLFIAFEFTFMSLTVALVSGGLIERFKFSSWVLFVILWTSLVYIPIAHWVWHPLGFLNNWGVLDYAGGTVVHINSGIATLVVTLVLGKRLKPHENPRNMTLVLIGTCLLWFGFMGFNAGSSFRANQSSSISLLNTNLSAAVSSLVWMTLQISHTGKPTLAGLCDGAISGLVGITPASGYVNVVGAVVIGIFEGIIPYWAIYFKTEKNLYDDTFNTFALHCIAGSIGAVLLGVYSDKKICNYNEIRKNCRDGALSGKFELVGWQVVGVLVSMAYSAFGTFCIIWVLQRTVGVRVSSEEEREGLDVAQHGGYVAYREFGEREMFEIEEVSSIRLNQKINITT